MSRLERIAIVGASLAGLRTAEFLRRAKFDGRLILIGGESRPPYDRPPLSKEILRGEWSEGRLALARKSYEELGIDLALGCRAVGVDLDVRAVELQDGGSISFDGLVIATGGLARTLPDQPAIDGIFTLRTLDDALAIRRAMADGPRVAVVGAGFIGAEVAASARKMGLDVTMIEAEATPLALTLGTRLGTILRRAHERRGVRVLCGRRVSSFVGSHCVQGLALDDGTVLECELVVIGVGMSPSVSWLEGSGIALDDGVQCDATLATNVSDVVAAGDVANWLNPLFEERMRVEHWTNAVEQARHAAGTLLAGPGEAKSFESAPLFWSDQYDIRIQGAGRHRPEDDVTVMGPNEQEKLVALYSRGDQLVGAITFNRPRTLVQLRSLIARRGSLDEAVEIADP